MKNKVEIIIPIFLFHYTGKVDIDRVFIENYDVNTLEPPEDYVFSDDVLTLKKFDVNNYSLNIDWEFFSSYEKEIMKESKWAITFFIDEDEEADKYTVNVNLLMLAIRVRYNSSCFIKYKLCENNPRHSHRITNIFMPSIPDLKSKECYKIDELKIIDKTYLQIISLFNLSFRSSNALDFTYRAYNEYYAMTSFLLYITAIESFYLPYDYVKIGETLKERITKFINDSAIANPSLISSLYLLRSDIIHGKIKSNIKLNYILPKISTIQKILNKTIEKIIDDNLIETIYKDEDSKERYFKSL
jgi:hypothetical protein